MTCTDQSLKWAFETCFLTGEGQHSSSDVLGPRLWPQWESGWPCYWTEQAVNFHCYWFVHHCFSETFFLFSSQLYIYCQSGLLLILGTPTILNWSFTSVVILFCCTVSKVMGKGIASWFSKTWVNLKNTKFELVNQLGSINPFSPSTVFKALSSALQSHK